jgi:hypothetical protein
MPGPRRKLLYSWRMLVRSGSNVPDGTGPVPVSITFDEKSNALAKTNFQYEKRQKDLEKKRKKEEKLKKKADKASLPGTSPEGDDVDVDVDSGADEAVTGPGTAPVVPVPEA